MKKTAITLIIDELEDVQSKYVEFEQQDIWHDFQRLIKKAVELRDTTEREQMISMAENAYWDIIGGGVINTTNPEQVRKDAENLFNGTYGNGQ